MTNAAIIGTGRHLPDKVLTNADLEKMVETSDEWITSRSGIKERRIAEPGTSASALGLPAAKRALAKAGLSPADLDAIIVPTMTPDMLFPATACLIQRELGAKRAIAFDLQAACSGFIYGLEVGRQFIAAGTYKYVLICATEVMSAVIDWTDRSTCVLFGDGAGAVVLAPCEEGYGILAAHLHSDGREADLIEMPGGGSRNPATQETIAAGLHYLKMKGNEVFKFGVRLMSMSVRHVLAESGIPEEKVDLLIPHQANIRIILAMAERLKIPLEKIYINLYRYGNTSAASIPIALDEALEERRINPNDVVVLSAIGGGLSWGAVCLRWPK
ncbi:MAG: beta-ketoacyl-ACP synthase III [bacterium]|nr:beta-ketoacyl-ACP synthase III [bacterium]